MSDRIGQAAFIEHHTQAKATTEHKQNVPGYIPEISRIEQTNTEAGDNAQQPYKTSAEPCHSTGKPAQNG